MQKKQLILIIFLLMLNCMSAIAQSTNSKAGQFSLGMRSTASLFSDDGFGLGTGGQFRIQLSDAVNTDWFADYIVVNANNNVRSEFYHIGWSVLFYPLESAHLPAKKFEPFILAGHCFDYNKKTLINDPSINRDRWGSAVQAGIGVHYFISERLDLTLMSQYMIHLTKEIELENENGEWIFTEQKGNALEGHLLTTIGINYKIFNLW